MAIETRGPSVIVEVSLASGSTAVLADLFVDEGRAWLNVTWTPDHGAASKIS
jgi:hypothetical protein